jgi:deoxyribodipyrimidine photo-lyase
MRISIWWLRRDLRLHDNAALATARAASQSVYALYCRGELDALNARQRVFASHALRSLRQALDKQDASLTIADGSVEEALPAAAQRLGATRVYAARALAASEREIEARARVGLQAAGIELCVEDGTVVHAPEAIAERKQAPGEGYRIFPPFYDVWKSIPVPRPLAVAAPNGRDAAAGTIPEPRGTFNLPPATEAVALDALQRFVASRAVDYGANSEYPGRGATSLLAPYLRFGLLSARTIYHAIAERMARSWTLAEERFSMEAFLRRLALRDFFLHLAHYAPEMHTEALQEKMRGFPWSHDEASLALWRDGKTGYPLVDAAMRQLQLEGYVHQRAAVCAASFCSCDLGLDWRLGRDVWVAELLAADEALCDGNWQRIAGIGSDQAAYPRIYNPVRQAQLFDSQATYVRRYCRELAKLPTRAALAPWELGRQQQVELGFFTPQHYPAPIVDHEVAAREFLAKYQAYRNRES